MHFKTSNIIKDGWAAELQSDVEVFRRSETDRRDALLKQIKSLLYSIKTAAQSSEFVDVSSYSLSRDMIRG